MQSVTCEQALGATSQTGEVLQPTYELLVLQGTHGGLAIQFSACTDEQTAADTNQLSGNVSTGAATFSFIQVCLLKRIMSLEPGPCSSICICPSWQPACAAWLPVASALVC